MQKENLTDMKYILNSIVLQNVPQTEHIMISMLLQNPCKQNREPCLNGTRKQIYPQ